MSKLALQYIAVVVGRHFGTIINVTTERGWDIAPRFLAIEVALYNDITALHTVKAKHISFSVA